MKAILASIDRRRRVHLMFMVGQLLKKSDKKCKEKSTRNQEFFCI
jgi:hypothetical protein